MKAMAMTRRILLDFYEANRTNVKYYEYGIRTWTREDMEYAKEAESKRALYNLRARKFIEIRKTGDKIFCRLTEKGRIAALKDKIRFAQKSRDGKLVSVSFDIPEQERYIRTKLRYLLKDLGFVQVQRSLWVSDSDVGVLMAKAVFDLKASKWVKIFESKEIK